MGADGVAVGRLADLMAQHPDPNIVSIFEQALAAGDTQRAARLAAVMEGIELQPRTDYRVVVFDRIDTPELTRRRSSRNSQLGWERPEPRGSGRWGGDGQDVGFPCLRRFSPFRHRAK
jgi:hypothetical protein